ncbi:hypothetical protein GW207_11950 [Salmonella enterica subsp. arizonae serovar 40:z4,z32:-]|nr:hypothetical protein [Salmonella enterica subsp. arizonae]EEF7980313.1 hypothetical protein [Salmonella enterica subsp. arizonae serovar 40:z4,z32:-]
MDGQTLHACAKRFALERPFTEHCWPFGPQYDVFKVGGKIFMLFAGEDITVSLLNDLINDSWNLVVDSLPKRDQQRLRPR